MAKTPKSKSSSGSAQRPKRPVRYSDDTDLVLGPGGLRPRSLTHELKPGEHVSVKGGRVRIIETATGKAVRISAKSESLWRTKAGLPLALPSRHVSGTGRLSAPVYRIMAGS